MNDTKTKMSEKALAAAFRLSKSVLNTVVEDSEIKAFAPDSSTFKEFSDVTTNIMMNKLRDKVTN